MKKIAAGVAGIVAIAVAAVLLLRSSDEEKIENLLRECGDAAQKGDAETIIRHLDPSCTLGDQPYASLCERLRKHVGEAKGMRVDLGSAISVSGDEGAVKLHVKVSALQHGIAEGEAALRLKKMAGEWKFVRVDEAR